MNEQKLCDDAAYKEWREFGKRVATIVTDLMSDDGENGGWERGMRALADIAGVDIPALNVKAEAVDIRDVIGGRA